MSTSGIVSSSHSKINPSHPQRSKPQRPPRRPRPHGHPRPDRYRPPARYALDMGKHASLALTLARYNTRPNAATVARIGGDE